MYRALAGIGFLCAWIACLPSSSPPEKDIFNLDQLTLDTLLEAQLDSKIEEKKKQYESASRREKPYVALVLGYLYYRQNNYTQARLYLLEVANRKDFLLKDYAYFYLGRIDLNQKHCPEASQTLMYVKEHFPDSGALSRLENLWNDTCRFHIDSTSKTKQELLKKVRLDLYHAAIENYEARDYHQAIPQFKDFLEKVHHDHPQVEEAMIKLAIIYKRTGHDENYLKILKSLSRYRKASKKFPYNPKWLYEIARFYWNKEKIALTKQKLKKLIEWPYHRYVGRSYFILAKIEAENKRYKSALSYLTKAAVYSVNPQTLEEIAYLKGWYAYKLKDHRQASVSFESFRTVFPESDVIEKATYWLGRSYLNLGEKTKAEEMFQHIIESTPYSYYGIRSHLRLNKTRQHFQAESKVVIDYPHDEVSHIINTDILKKSEKLIRLGFGEDGAYELQLAAPFRMLFKTPWSFQYYTAVLYSVSGDHISSFTILNELQKNQLEKLPPEHLKILYPRKYWSLITQYAAQFSLDPYLILSIMRQESAFDPEAISPADAYGLLQITPHMARVMGKKLGRPLKSKEELLNPEINLFYCSFYLSELLKKYKGDLILSLATYNSNDQSVKKWKKRYGFSDPEEFIEQIPYQETRNYVKLILRNYTNNLYIHEGVYKIYPEKLSQPPHPSPPAPEAPLTNHLFRVSTTLEINV